MSESQKAPRAAQQELPQSIEVVANAVEDLKARDLLVLDLRGVASFTDYLVICTGSSDRHVQAIVDGIRQKLRAVDVSPLHTEGYEQASWVLVDFVDFLVNVFTPETRDFYQLERVWRDAPVLLGERPDSAADGAGGAREDGEEGESVPSADADPGGTADVADG